MQRSSTSGRARQIAVALGLYALIGGLLSFIGWAADLPRLTDWDQSGISIQPNAALAVVVAATGLLFLTFGLRRLTDICGVVVLLLGSSALFQYATGISLGIDTLFLFNRTWGTGGTLAPGRMGPPGAVSWVFVGITMIAASWSSRQREYRLAMTLTLGTTAIALLSLIGYLYGVSSLYSIPTATVIALQTATFILAVSAGLLVVIPEYGLARLLTEPGPSGLLVRRLLPAVLAVPVVLGLLRLAGQRAGLYDLAFGTALRTLLEISVLLTMLWLTTRAISRQTRRREQAEQMLQQSERQLRTQLEADLADRQLLLGVSAAIIRENDDQALYEKILDAAVAIMKSQFASMQMLQPGEHGGPWQLKLLAFRGFPEYAASRWQLVDADTTCVCGMALKQRRRVVVSNVLTHDQIVGTEHEATYRQTGIAAVQSTPLFSRHGRVLGMISTHWSTPHVPTERELGLLDILARQAADLFDRRQSEDALRDADRRKDEFLATLAHELRNPLAPVRSAVDLMEDRLPPEADLVWARGVIDRQVGLMSRLLDDLLDVGRIAQDRLDLRKERLDLRAVIQTATEMSRPLVAGFRHELQLMLPDKPVEIDADPARLSQVFGNLLNNACRYTPPAGHITVTVEQIGDTAVVRVRDSGIGIRAAELPNIFQMFFQADQSLERSQSGLGIGLHLARRLVEMHGGSIEAYSRGQGEGSEFIVRLPCAVAEVASETPAPQAGRRQPPARSRRILVVDDNVDAATSLMMLLSMDGHDVHMAHDGLAALDAAERLRPDVILLDIGMPRLNGFDVCRRIREQPWGQRIFIIAVTGWGQDLDRRRSEEAGFNHHVVKPVEHAALSKLLASEPQLV